MAELINSPRSEGFIRCESLSTEVAKVKSRLDSIILDGSKQGSAAVKEALLNLMDESWEIDSLISRQAPRDFPTANFKINYLRVISDCSCDERHKIFLHRCFDNRQAIGANLLRFEVASKELNDWSGVFIAIVASSRAKKVAWDGSVATYEEYVHSLNGPYSKIFQAPIDFMVMDV